MQRRRDGEGAGATVGTELDVHALYDGDGIEPFETVMTIEGDYDLFAHLETRYLGVLARRTRIATNARRDRRRGRRQGRAVFPGAFRPLRVQPGDGYAAPRRGCDRRRLDRRPRLLVGRRAGRHLPHALIAAYGGDTVLASEKFAEHSPDVNLISLVDYDNDCVATSLAVARAWAALVGRAARHVGDAGRPLGDPSDGQPSRPGVNPQLVRNVRAALDEAGFGFVKIVVSGGFNVGAHPCVRARRRAGRRLRRRQRLLRGQWVL